MAAGRDGGGIVGVGAEGHIIATYKIRDQQQFDRNYKLAWLQTTACLWHGSPQLIVTVSK